MMIETDILLAFIKKADWLKPVAEDILTRISAGKLGVVDVPREVLHELYYVATRSGISLDELIERYGALTSVDNLVFLETTPEIDLLALTLMKQYNLGSVFDAYYAATALNQVPDHTVISTDEVYDRIPGLKRIDPRSI